MRFKKAKQYVEKVLPVLTNYFREKYYKNFEAPEIEYDNRWILGRDHGGYRYLCDEIVIRRNARICLKVLGSTLAHELGHALLDQINPEFYFLNLEDGDYTCLCEGIAEVLEEEGADMLIAKGLGSGSFLGRLRNLLNVGFNPNYWVGWTKNLNLPYDQGKKSICILKEKGLSLEDIMKQAHEPRFAHSIPYSCKAVYKNNELIGWKEYNRL